VPDRARNDSVMPPAVARVVPPCSVNERLRHSFKCETEEPRGVLGFPGLSPFAPPVLVGGPARLHGHGRVVGGSNRRGSRTEPERSVDDDNAEKWAANR
jgi:hypothetical protein